jgi:hypothetical protein
MILILSGPSGSGKSSACAAVHRALARSNAMVAGVICVAVFDKGIKTGIDAVLPGTGTFDVPLARIRAGFDPGTIQGNAEAGPAKRRVPTFDDADPTCFSYGMWNFDVNALRTVDEAVALYVGRMRNETRGGGSPGGHPVVIVDEIGPLELDHGLGFMKTLAAIDGSGSGAEGSAIDWIVTARPEITATLERRWPAVRVIIPVPSGGFPVAGIVESIGWSPGSGERIL